ncbi:MAG: hypothetical protein Q9204_000053 [Flavoplaca sp. TL-2023a]
MGQKPTTRTMCQQIQATKNFKADVKVVLLIGGFGESENLYQRLRDTVASQGIIVEKPSYGWTAIQRGALMKGLVDYSSKNTRVAVTGRSARYHYGTESAKEWDERLHPNDQRIWSSVNSPYEVNTYKWFIGKSETVSETKPKRLYYHTESLTSLKKLDNITVTVIQCEDLNDEGAPFFVSGQSFYPYSVYQTP